MSEEQSQPTTHSMTSHKRCFYSRCDTTPKWSVESSAQAPLKTLILYSCDDHYGALTGELRKAGTKYTLLPINGPHMTPPCDCGPTEEELFEEHVARMSWPKRLLVKAAVVILAILIAPFVFIYYISVGIGRRAVSLWAKIKGARWGRK